ncbi:hypothetical protein ACIOMM_35460 [Streptomyces sp. NPDC087908]|uniref:hypothetical protein n=1 Tax=Streptomyces sp. NPDC087908 TaxID=3365820 RepID=UPI003809B32D
MAENTKHVRERQVAGRRIVQVARKLGGWFVQGAVAGIVREVMRYALNLWVPM